MRVRFSDCLFDDDRRELTVAGTPVHLSPKAFDLLGVLIRERPRAIRKDELFGEIWPDTVVSAANLNNLISELRGALGDRDKSIIVTRPRYGYAFAAAATEDSPRSSRPGRETLRVSFGPRSWELHEGRNLIGREDDCAIIIEAPEISRYHASIDVEEGEAVLHDLGSKNGTFLGGHRIAAPARLGDQDEIGLGRHLLRFTRARHKPSTVSDSR